MNNQEVFNTVARHLFAQGKRATAPNGDACRYRAKDGSRCAIGCLLPDKGVYSSRMENNSIWGLLGDSSLYPHFPSLRKFFQENEIDFLTDIQDIHDTQYNWNSTESMKVELSRLAQDYKLNTEVLDELKFADR